MNKIGLHFGYWNTDGTMRSIDDLVALSKKSGIDVIEAHSDAIVNMSKLERNELKRKLATEDLLISFSGGLTPNTDITADDSQIRKRGIEYSKHVLEAISEVGGAIWCGVNYSLWLRRPNNVITYEEKKRILELSIDSMRQIIKTAENVGVVYCFEVVNRFEQFLINTVEEGIAYCEAVGSSNGKLLLDTFHMNIEEDSIKQAISLAGRRGFLSHFHVGESNRRIPGIGQTHMDWKGIFTALNDVKYTGFIIMEPFIHMGNFKTCVWRELAIDPSDEGLINDVTRGAKYIRDMFSEIK